MTKSVASETDVPAGLDVVPMEPGTIVGSRDVQGADGTTRTDRPGEILGTPITDDVHLEGRAREDAKHDYVRSEVDRANREELPRLGGSIDDGWEPGDSKGVVTKGTRTTDAVAGRGADTAPVAHAETAKAAPAKAADSGISVKSGIDRG